LLQRQGRLNPGAIVAGQVAVKNAVKFLAGIGMGLMSRVVGCGLLPAGSRFGETFLRFDVRGRHGGRCEKKTAEKKQSQRVF
jgi:hypothetical protein